MPAHRSDHRPVVAPVAMDDVPDRTFDHGPVSSFNAWFFGALAGPINHFAGPHKRRAFASIAAGNVVELGAGAGANVGYLPATSRLYGVEPNRRMHDRLRTSCRRGGIELVLVPTGAERLPLPDGSVDEVLCSLVLCTVADPDAVLAEVVRILRPGGRFRFVEHVAAPRGLRARVQRAIRRPWGWVFEGCDPHRHTVEHIERAGFASVESTRQKLRHSPFWPVNTAAWGIATR